jgi:hypothetical protein
VNDDAKLAAAAIAGGALGAALLKRSFLARAALAGGIALAVYTRLAQREPTWHDVEPPR